MILLSFALIRVSLQDSKSLTLLLLMGVCLEFDIKWEVPYKFGNASKEK